jgi:hypothetical protein
VALKTQKWYSYFDFFLQTDIITQFADLDNPKSADCVHHSLPEINRVEVKLLEAVGVKQQSVLNITSCSSEN